MKNSLINGRGGLLPAGRVLSIIVLITAILGLLSWLSVPVSGAKSDDPSHRLAPDTVWFDAGPALGSFTRAAAVDVSPSGVVYVADAGAHIVRIYEIDGSSGDLVPADPAGLGGVGAKPGQFIQPSGVDASTALFVTVADAGNARVQRFTADGSLVEVIPIPSKSGAGLRPHPRFRSEDAAIDGLESGARPVAVRSTPSDALLVVDGNRGVVLLTDRRRRSWTILGGPDRRPARPVDVEFFSGQILVPDVDRNAMDVYDQFASYIETIPVPGDDPLRGTAVTESLIIGILSTGLITYDARFQVGARYVPRAMAEPIVDAAVAKKHIVLLTRQNLYLVSRTFFRQNRQ